VLNPFTTRTQPGKGLSLLLAVAVAASASRFAHAATLTSVPDCSATGGGLECYLPGILHFLSVIAIVLGVILLVVVALAIKSYLKNKDDEKVGS
jgi:hypothetical protein